MYNVRGATKVAAWILRICVFDPIHLVAFARAPYHLPGPSSHFDSVQYSSCINQMDKENHKIRDTIVLIYIHFLIFFHCHKSMNRAMQTWYEVTMTKITIDVVHTSRARFLGVNFGESRIKMKSRQSCKLQLSFVEDWLHFGTTTKTINKCLFMSEFCRPS